MMTKEDYMNLPKERLAELLVEAELQIHGDNPNITPTKTWNDCPYGGKCTNPFHDCIGCPGHGNTGGFTSPNIYIRGGTGI